jgi:hypothetical protein
MQNEITIDVAGFRKVLDMVKGCVPAKPNLPILSDVKLDWNKQKNMFTLSATNTDQHIQVECAERTKTDDGTRVEQCVHMLKEDPKEGWRPVCLPYAALQEAFKLLPAARRCMVTLTEKQDGTVRQMLIDYQDGKLKLGVRSSNMSSSYWVVVDNFCLHFYGQTDTETHTGIEKPAIAGASTTMTDNIYSLDGRLVRRQATSLDGLQPGLYIMGGKKVVVR